jgi:CubicO group peptidase (beta-lactamase class C family)
MRDKGGGTKRRLGRGACGSSWRCAGRCALALTLAALGCEGGFRGPGGPGADPEALAASVPASAAGPASSAAYEAVPVRPRPLGLDSTLLVGALAEAATLPRLHNMIVARHGEVIAERHFRGPALDAPANVKSASKSVISALVGIAIAEGRLELDQPVAPFFGRYLGPEPDSAKDAITLRHLLSMRSGLESTSSRNYGRWVNSPDWVRFAITRPLESPPGARMIYSTGNTHLLSYILTQATGVSTHEFARTRLAAPLGMRLPSWPRDPQGIYFGGNDMLVSPRDLLRFGELYRNGGVWEGKALLPAGWVEESWRMVTRSQRSRQAYGLGWWGRESNGLPVRFAWGYGGQFLFIVPDLELTVVFTSDPWSPREGPHNRRLHDMLDDYLVPAALQGGVDARRQGAAGASSEGAGRSPT